MPPLQPARGRTVERWRAATGAQAAPCKSIHDRAKEQLAVACLNCKTTSCNAAERTSATRPCSVRNSARSPRPRSTAYRAKTCRDWRNAHFNVMTLKSLLRSPRVSGAAAPRCAATDSEVQPRQRAGRLSHGQPYTSHELKYLFTSYYLPVPL